MKVENYAIEPLIRIIAISVFLLFPCIILDLVTFFINKDNCSDEY